MLAYQCDPDECLEPAQADLNWLRLQLDSTREHLRLERTKHRKTTKDHLGLQTEHQAIGAALAEEQQRHEATRAALALASAQVEALRRRLAPIDAVRSAPRRIAGRARRIAGRFNPLA